MNLLALLVKNYLDGVYFYPVYLRLSVIKKLLYA